MDREFEKFYWNLVKDEYTGDDAKPFVFEIGGRSKRYVSIETNTAYRVYKAMQAALSHSKERIAGLEKENERLREQLAERDELIAKKDEVFRHLLKRVDCTHIYLMVSEALALKKEDE